MRNHEEAKVGVKGLNNNARLDGEDEIDIDDPNLGSIQWLKDWEEDQKGSPEDPRAAAYYATVRLIDLVLEQEIKRRPRLRVVVEDFHRRRRQILEMAEHGETLAAQFDSMQEAAQAALYEPVDARKGKTGKGPDNAGLLSECISLHPVVKDVLRLREFCNYDTVAAKLRSEFPQLTGDQAREASCLKPSMAVCIVLGARHDLSAGQIKKRLTAARREMNDRQPNRDAGKADSTREDS